MKKFILSASVIAIFSLSVLLQRSGVQSLANMFSGSRRTRVIAPPPSILGNAGNESANATAPSSVHYRDGSYTGSVADAYYGKLQVAVTIQIGKITDVQFLQYPSDQGTSVMINNQAMPYLKAEAIQAQQAQVEIVSGATQTSQAFRESLAAALGQAV